MDMFSFESPHLELMKGYDCSSISGGDAIGRPLLAKAPVLEVSKLPQVSDLNFLVDTPWRRAHDY